MLYLIHLDVGRACSVYVKERQVMFEMSCNLRVNKAARLAEASTTIGIGIKGGASVQFELT